MQINIPDQTLTVVVQDEAVTNNILAFNFGFLLTSSLSRGLYVHLSQPALITVMLYVGVSQACLSPLQLVKVSISSLELVKETTSPLHWLPVHFRIDFKTIVCFKAPHGPDPDYITDLLKPFAPSRSLRFLLVPKTRLYHRLSSFYITTEKTTFTLWL